MLHEDDSRRVILRSVADEHLTAEALQQLNEPGAVAADFYPDAHLAREAGVEATDVIPFVLQFAEVERTVSRVTVAKGVSKLALRRKLSA